MKAGSSPLTRGKRNGDVFRPGRERLIPAHAGKTWSSPRALSKRSAHPRSRGENPKLKWQSSKATGSSPLTRGKPFPFVTKCHIWGLIPAHAGKTLLASGCAALMRAHPRSRGENLCGGRDSRQSGGSSPLTRGKLRQERLGTDDRRLIPAHAGKTRPRRRAGRAGAAHPRSRGEN